jgi:RES domain-containing protein
MRLFRIAHPDFADPFDGEGARRYGGRWNPKGVPLRYYASTLALAALEKRVHTPAAALGRLWTVIHVEVPDRTVTTADPATLPPDWSAHPAPDSAKAFGRAWVQSGASLGLMVPSTIIPGEANVIVNPAHPDLRFAWHVHSERFVFDPRLAQ